MIRTQRIIIIRTLSWGVYPQLELCYLKIRMFMMLKNTPYKWLAYLVGWFIFESFIGYSKRYDLTQESFTVFVLISLLVNSICSYRFGKEKGKIAGVLIFIIGLVICILIAFFIYAVALGASMMH